MPITAINKEYSDAFGNTNTFYQANAGDSYTAEYTFFETIRIESSASNILSYNPATKTITWSNGSFLGEGFRIGDEISVLVYNSGGTLIHTSVVDVVVADVNYIIHNSTIIWYNVSAGDSLVIVVNYKIGDKRKGLLVDVNHVANATPGTEFSLIDGEVTRFTFDLSNTAIVPNVSGTQVGLKSGQFATFANLTDLTTYPNNIRTYTLTINYVQSGIYDSNLFSYANCLKLYVKTNWQRVFGDPNNMTSYLVNDQADTGWYDEAYNTGLIDAILVQGINAIDYSATNTGQISIDTNASDFYFGASYVPNDDTYYKNQIYNQSELGMTAPTQGGIAPIVFTGAFANPNGANYTLTFSNPVTLGTITTWDWEFVPNNDFVTFMDGRSSGDRLFYIWCKAGNVNLLLFANQLFSPPKLGDPLNVVVHDFVDHSENITDTLITQNGFTGNVEDDIAFIGKFILPINSTIGYVRAEINALNTLTNESFNLSIANFDFGSIPQVFGYYPVNSSIPVISTLPTTSVKRNALLIRDLSVDTLTDYGIRIHFPFLYNWQYWLNQSNANAVFYPNQQTQNWVPYGNTIDWTLNLKLSALIDGLVSEYNEQIEIKDYDSNPEVVQNIELYVENTMQNVQVVIEGELMRVIAQHELIYGSIWDQSSVWGMITIEPTESNPRSICSTIIPFDNDILNPLTPITGNLCSLSFPATNIAQMECYFDSSKINLENGVKFTTKVKGCTFVVTENMKLLTDGQVKLTTGGLPKLLS